MSKFKKCSSHVALAEPQEKRQRPIMADNFPYSSIYFLFLLCRGTTKNKFCYIELSFMPIKSSWKRGSSNDLCPLLVM